MCGFHRRNDVLQQNRSAGLQRHVPARDNHHLRPDFHPGCKKTLRRRKEQVQSLLSGPALSGGNHIYLYAYHYKCYNSFTFY